MIEAPKYTPSFKAEVITALLLNIAVTGEFSSRYGVPPVQVRRWIRDTVRHLDEIFEETASVRDSPRLSPGELAALLHKAEAPGAESRL